MPTERRTLLKSLALGLSSFGLSSLSLSASARAAGADPMLEPGSDTLAELMAKLAAASRRRDFKSVPMILTSKDQFDAEAIKLVLASRCEPRQVWNNYEIESYWLTVMRNALNTQIWGWDHPDFLVVSATHGSAGLALYDEATWDKYQIAKLLAAKTDKRGARFTTNAMLNEPAGDPKDFESTTGLFSMGTGDSIPLLMKRGVVFMACHNAVWGHAEVLIKHGQNPDKLGPEALAAELTNHLIPGTVLTPGVVGTLPELQRVGFAYANI